VGNVERCDKTLPINEMMFHVRRDAVRPVRRRGVARGGAAGEDQAGGVAAEPGSGVHGHRAAERPAVDHRAAQLECPDEIVERQARVDDVFHDQHVATADVEIEVLEHADLLVPAHDRAAVAGELDEVDRVQDRDCAGEVGGEDEACLERRDEHRLAARVVACDLGPQLPDAGADLRRGEVDFSDPVVGRQVTGLSWRG